MMDQFARQVKNTTLGYLVRTGGEGAWLFAERAAVFDSEPPLNSKCRRTNGREGIPDIRA